MDKDDRREINSEMNWMGRKALVWALIAFVLSAIIGVGIWVFSVATSDVKGRGDVVKINNSAPNRIAAQERFETLWGEIKTADGNIDTAWENLQADKTNPTLLTNYTGVQNHCRGLVNEYNALARKVTKGDWRSPDLPYEIDAANPATDCKREGK